MDFLNTAAAAVVRQESDDMFQPPRMEEEEFSPFGGGGGLFSGGRGLFDDDDEVGSTFLRLKHFLIDHGRQLTQFGPPLLCVVQGDLFGDTPKRTASEDKAKSAAHMAGKAGFHLYLFIT